MYLSSLVPISCIFPSWVFSGLSIGRGCCLMAARWQVFFSALCFFRAHQLPIEDCNHRWLWHHLFTPTYVEIHSWNFDCLPLFNLFVPITNTVSFFFLITSSLHGTSLRVSRCLLSACMPWPKIPPNQPGRGACCSGFYSRKQGWSPPSPYWSHLNLL